MSIAFGIILAGIARYIVVERTSGLKHLQSISGMQLKSYWIGTFIFDLLKMYLSIIVALILFAAFDLDLNASMLPLVLLPLGAIPFTYVTSFLFNSESAASSISILLSLVFLGILSSITFTFRIAIPPFMKDGDTMHNWFHLIPVYNIGSAMFCDRQCETLSDVRKTPGVDATGTSPDKWAFPNMTTDSLFFVYHLVFWTIMLIIIEKGFFGMLICKINTPFKTHPDQLDDDVIREAKRVED